MKKSRALWSLWLLCAILFAVGAESALGYLLLFVSLCLPLAGGMVYRRGGGGMKADLTADAYGEKNRELAGRLAVENGSFLPLDRVICRISCENLLTGECETTSIRLAVPARTRVETALRWKCRHAGRVRISVRQLTYFDGFGLFRFRRTPAGTKTALALILPETFPVETQLAYGESVNMDSDEYSMSKAGFDPSETFAIREYQPGDRVRQIHWKLTEKLDTLMVRDYGLPIQNTILLLLETGRQPGSEKSDPDCLDALAEAFLSVSQELLSQQIVHSIGWQNHEENTFTCREVENEEEWNGLLPELLGAVPGEDPMTVAEHYMAAHEQLEFAHVVVFTTEHQPNSAFLAGQCLVTEIICDPRAADYDSQDGMAMIGVSPERMAEALSYLEI